MSRGKLEKITDKIEMLFLEIGEFSDYTEEELKELPLIENMLIELSKDLNQSISDIRLYKKCDREEAGYQEDNYSKEENINNIH